MKRDSFIFYKSFFDSIKELDLIDQAQIYNAIFNYQFEGEKIELNGFCKSIFTLIIPQLEANNKRYLNGLKGGKPKAKDNQKETKTKPKDNQNIIKSKANENENDNDNDIKETISKDIVKKRFIKPSIQEIEIYCKERNNNVDANKFYDFYESKDWMVGKNKMKDWKACVRTWEQRDTKEKLPSWFNKEPEERKLSDEEQRQLDELIRGY